MSPASRVLILYKLVTELICTYGSPGKAVLVFLLGINEISQLHEIIEKAALEKSLSVRVYILHSQIPHEEQQGVFDSPSTNEVVVVLATNIAESSITIPALNIVINFYVRHTVQYNCKVGISRLRKPGCQKLPASREVGDWGINAPDCHPPCR